MDLRWLKRLIVRIQRVYCKGKCNGSCSRRYYWWCIPVDCEFSCNDMIMPVISLLTGGVNFSNWVIRIGSGENDTIKYGNFITAVINFLLMALVIFCFVKVMNNLASRTEKLLKKEEEAPAAPATKICPYCMSEIPIAATRCAYCTSELPAEDTDKEE